MSTRIKAPSLKTRAEFDTAVDELARLTVELRRAEARRDTKIQVVRDELEPACVAIKDQITGLALVAEKFAEAHREELLPGKIKSAETPLAVFGFRLGQPTLLLLNKKCSWAGVVLAAKSLGLGQLIRKSEEEPNKDAIKAAKLSDATLAQLGVRINQSESFFVEPKERAEERGAA